MLSSPFYRPLSMGTFDSQRSRLYHDLILISLGTSAHQTFEDTMNSPKYEYRSELLRRYVGEGRQEGLIKGRMEGRVDLILELLARRFGPLEDEIQTRVRCAQEAQLGAVTDRMMTAQTLEQALGSLY